MIDIHIHLMKPKKPDPVSLLESMYTSGVSEGFIISPPPASFTRSDPDSLHNRFANRLDTILEWCDRGMTRTETAEEDSEPRQNKLHPIMWIDPHDSAVDIQIKEAKSKGIEGFKIICTQSPPDHPEVIKAARQIAQLNMPIIFHSGILWDGHNSSSYNRPASFEALIRIPMLRFSIAHASWPWIDECLAVYGKFDQLKRTQHDLGSELFIDLTPGTPPIYREDLIRKLLTIGYPIEDNILFGTDNMADDYDAIWAKEWAKLDRQLMERYTFINLHSELSNHLLINKNPIKEINQLWEKYTILNARRFLYGT